MKYLTNFKKHFSKLYSLIFLFLFLPKITFGQGGVDLQVKLDNPLNANSFEELIASIMDVIIQLGVPILAILIMYSGFKFVEAQGNKSKLEEAKKSLWYVIIGTAIVLGAGTILSIIRTTTEAL